MTVSIAADISGMLSVMVPGEAGFEADVAGNDEGMRGNEEDVVERQRLPDDTHAGFSYAQKWIIPALRAASSVHASGGGGSARDARGHRSDRESTREADDLRDRMERICEGRGPSTGATRQPAPADRHAGPYPV